MGEDHSGATHGQGHGESVVSSTPVPVPKGKLRLHGAFTGTVTSDSVLLDVALPIQGEVPKKVIGNVVKALAADNAGHMTQTQSQPSQVLHELGEMFLGNGGADGEAKPIRDVADRVDMEEEELLEDFPPKYSSEGVDLRDRVRDLAAERDHLAGENARLREELEVAASRVEDKAAGASEQVVVSSRSSGATSDRRSSAATSVAETGDALADVIWLDGCFSGNARTKTLLVDVSLPIRGPVPGKSAVHVLRRLAGAAASARILDPDVAKTSSLGDGSGSMEQLADMLNTEFATQPDDSGAWFADFQQSLTAKCAAAERSRQRDLEEQLDEAAKKTAAQEARERALEKRLEEAADEIQRLRMEAIGSQKEADGLRAKAVALQAQTEGDYIEPLKPLPAAHGEPLKPLAGTRTAASPTWLDTSTPVRSAFSPATATTTAESPGFRSPIAVSPCADKIETDCGDRVGATTDAVGAFRLRRAQEQSALLADLGELERLVKEVFTVSDGYVSRIDGVPPVKV